MTVSYRYEVLVNQVPYQFKPNVWYQQLILLVHVDDLHEGESEAELQGVTFVDDGSLQDIVAVQEVV